MSALLSSTSYSSSVGYLPTSTLDTFATSLPPTLLSAIPTRCSFRNQTELFHHLDEHWKGLNASLLVEMCPDVCVTIYGTGNPDISGAGAMISYILQFILLACCGPMLDLLEVYLKPQSERGKQIIYLVYMDAGKSVHLGCLFMAFALSVASLVRTQQEITVFEQNFVINLAGLQFFLTLAISIQCVKSGFKAEKHGDELRSFKGEFQQITMIGFWAVTFLATTWANMSSYDKKIAENMQSVARFCHGFNSLKIPRSPRSFAFWAVTTFPVGIALVFIVGFVIVIYCLPVLDMIFKICRNMSASIARYPAPAQKFLSGCSELFVRAGLTSWAVYIWIPWLALCSWEISRMEASRKSIHDALGSAYQDLSWGFGQILALMAWIPVFFELGRQLLEILKAKVPEIQSEEQSAPLISGSNSTGNDQTDAELSQMPKRLSEEAE